MKKSDYFLEKMVCTSDKIYFQVIESPGVSVKLRKIRQKNTPYYISIWGDDDIGMVLEVFDFDEAKKIFNSIEDGITKNKLLALGFKQL